MIKATYNIKKAFMFIFVNTICAIVFGVLYYLVQFIERNAFFEPGTNMIAGDPQVFKQPLLRCIHFSLVSQTTIGYGGFVPYGTIASIINALHMVAIFSTNAYLIAVE